MTPWWSPLAAAGIAVVGSVVGYVLAGMNEARRDRRAFDRDRAMRARDATAAGLAERHRFQLETLLALQGDLQRFSRSVGRAMFFDHANARRGMGATLLPEDVNDEVFQAIIALNQTTARVIDEPLREAVGDLKALGVRLSATSLRLQGLTGEALEAAAARELMQFGDAVEALNALLGEVLRAELQWQPTGVDSSS